MTYETIKEFVDDYKKDGKTLPCTAQNADKEDVIISEGCNEDNVHFYELKTMQHNKSAMAVSTFYANGDVEDTFEY